MPIARGTACAKALGQPLFTNWTPPLSRANGPIRWPRPPDGVRLAPANRVPKDLSPWLPASYPGPWLGSLACRWPLLGWPPEPPGSRLGPWGISPWEMEACAARQKRPLEGLPRVKAYRIFGPVKDERDAQVTGSRAVKVTDRIGAGLLGGFGFGRESVREATPARLVKAKRGPPGVQGAKLHRVYLSVKDLCTSFPHHPVALAALVGGDRARRGL